MLYATLPEKLGLLSLILEASEKIRNEQDHFEITEIKLLASPYLLPRYGYGDEEETVPSDFLAIFNSLVNPNYWDKKFEAFPKEDSVCIDRDIVLSTIKVNPSKEIVNMLNAYSFLESELEYILRDFKERSTACDFIIRSLESFSHYIVICNLGLPISKLDRSRSVECNAPRTTLYNFLEASQDVPQFIKLLQAQWENIQKSRYYLQEGNQTIETFIINTSMLGEVAESLRGKFRYAGQQLFEQYGAWFPDRFHYCDTCKKAIISPREKSCDGIETRHPLRKMKESCGIFLHKNLSQALPYISEYLVVHSLRRLFSKERFFGFLAHSVYFDDEEIDIIALILLKHDVKIFPIEVQLSSNIDIKKTEEKFQKLEDLLKNIEYPDGYAKIYNLFITFEEPKEKRGRNFSIHYFSELNKIVENLVYS
jgi:hypothetical protein